MNWDDEETEAEFYEAIAWLEHQQTTQKHGYPKDNVMSDAQREARASDPTFWHELLSIAEDLELSEALKNGIRKRLSVVSQTKK